MESYCPLEHDTWRQLESLCVIESLEAGAFFCAQGVVPSSFGFVYQGLLRGFTSSDAGREYNKVFFPEATFPGSMVALLTRAPSTFAIQAVERSAVVRIDFPGYRRLLEARADLKWFQILYLEKNWLLAKEPREVALVQDNATQRYLRFLQEHPGLEARLTQYHVASHLGVTPTQLSRIRRELGKKVDPSST
ncbi:cAMP-binding protein [Enhygromyxa salina]|uniref:cAMP-binding protein n=2 Tax=Enhygromyxa salina TaxID=215803 RepID=A0A0C2DEI4_9BACT|nr:cAMP-binding protein [Enhygromyxa salina]